MAKSSKSPTPEFLEKRRKAIAEMANKRRRQQILRASGIGLQGDEKVTRVSSLSDSPPPPSQS